MYYVYEYEMPQVMAEQFERVATELGLTTDELFCRTLKYYIDHPEEFQAQKKYEGRPEVVRFVRQYPVLDGQSEDEARLLAEEDR